MAGCALIAVGFIGVVAHSEHAVILGMAFLGLILSIRACISLASLVMDQRFLSPASLPPLIVLAVASLCLAAPVAGLSALTTVLAAVLALDGLSRLPLIALVRFERWRDGVFLAIGEILLASLFAGEWLLPAHTSLMLLVGLCFCFSGYSLLRFSSLLRAASEGFPSLQPFLGDGLRSWYRELSYGELSYSGKQQPVAESPARRVRLYVWTPKAAVEGSSSCPLVDRYLMTFGQGGKPSAGHSALQIDPDLYVSHWPRTEISAGLRDLPHVFYSGRTKDIAGEFPPSYAFECDDWKPADRVLDFTTRNLAAVQAYWNAYRQNTAYNVTDRNCSIVVAGALELALEGSLHTQRPWLRLVQLLAQPALWQAAYLRSRAHHMCWTPGLVLDYAASLKQVVEPSAGADAVLSLAKTR